MERGTPDQRSWDGFYARTMQLPAPEFTAEFLSPLPRNGRVLDFGAGSGAWTAAFMRDRPDLAIDVLDKNIDKAAALPANFAGQKMALSFDDFQKPDVAYDAIWARSVLFFLDRPALDACFHTLTQSLAPQGVIAFTMVDACPNAELAKFHGMSEKSIMEMLDKEGMELVKLTRSKPPYGANRMLIPTFEIYARKK